MGQEKFDPGERPGIVTRGQLRRPADRALSRSADSQGPGGPTRETNAQPDQGPGPGNETAPLSPAPASPGTRSTEAAKPGPVRPASATDSGPVTGTDSSHAAPGQMAGEMSGHADRVEDDRPGVLKGGRRVDPVPDSTEPDNGTNKQTHTLPQGITPVFTQKGEVLFLGQDGRVVNWAPDSTNGNAKNGPAEQDTPPPDYDAGDGRRDPRPQIAEVQNDGRIAIGPAHDEQDTRRREDPEADAKAARDARTRETRELVQSGWFPGKDWVDPAQEEAARARYEGADIHVPDGPNEKTQPGDGRDGRERATTSQRDDGVYEADVVPPTAIGSGETSATLNALAAMEAWMKGVGYKAADVAARRFRVPMPRLKRNLLQSDINKTDTRIDLRRKSPLRSISTELTLSATTGMTGVGVLEAASGNSLPQELAVAGEATMLVGQLLTLRSDKRHDIENMPKHVAQTTITAANLALNKFGPEIGQALLHDPRWGAVAYLATLGGAPLVDAFYGIVQKLRLPLLQNKNVTNQSRADQYAIEMGKVLPNGQTTGGTLEAEREDAEKRVLLYDAELTDAHAERQDATTVREELRAFRREQSIRKKRRKAGREAARKERMIKRREPRELSSRRAERLRVRLTRDGIILNEYDQIIGYGERGEGYIVTDN